MGKLRNSLFDRGVGESVCLEVRKRWLLAFKCCMEVGAYEWQFKSSAVLHRVILSVYTNVSEKHAASIFGVEVNMAL